MAPWERVHKAFGKDTQARWVWKVQANVAFLAAPPGIPLSLAAAYWHIDRLTLLDQRRPGYGTQVGDCVPQAVCGWRGRGHVAMTIGLRVMGGFPGYGPRPFKLAGAAGLEPATYGFGDRRSTN